jgi:hypothetical protein
MTATETICYIQQNEINLHVTVIVYLSVSEHSLSCLTLAVKKEIQHNYIHTDTLARVPVNKVFESKNMCQDEKESHRSKKTPKRQLTNLILYGQWLIRPE